MTWFRDWVRRWLGLGAIDYYQQVYEWTVAQADRMTALSGELSALKGQVLATGVEMSLEGRVIGLEARIVALERRQAELWAMEFGGGRGREWSTKPAPLPESRA